MNASDTYVRARIDSETKRKATSALNSMGLTVSDAIRLLLVRIANDEQFPFDLKIPNEKTMSAMNEAVESMEAFNTAEDAMRHLDEGD